MFTYIKLKNFKSFSNITLDLRKAHGEPKKIAIIYGENGSGKSNLISSLLFLSKSVNTIINQTRLRDLLEGELHDMYEKEKKEGIIHDIFRKHFSTLSELVEDYEMIGIDGAMSLEFGFKLDGSDGSYFMEFSDNRIVKEELKYRLKKRSGLVFRIDSNQDNLSPTTFFDSTYSNELLETIHKYWGKHTFLALLVNEIQTKNSDYITSKIDNNLLKVLRFFTRYSVWCKESGGDSVSITAPSQFMRYLKKGTVNNQDDSELKQYETILNSYFTQLYSDVKSAQYVLTPEDNGFSYELYLTKKIGGKFVDIPFSLESTGTQKLLDIFPGLFACYTGESVFIDEIDSGIHDLLMKELLVAISDSLKGQLILTTHNTLLMENMPPESTYIIRVDAEGKKSINCVADYDDRTQKNNNMRKKYLRGDYDGIPYVGYIDFDDMVQEISTSVPSPSIGKT